MSILSNFYLNESGNFINDKLCHCFGGGGDGGASERAERDRQERLAKEARIKKNISLIDILFKNDPETRASQRSALDEELAGFGTAPPGFPGSTSPFARGLEAAALSQNPNFFDPNATRRKEIAGKLGTLDQARDLLTGPTQEEREASTISNVENFFFDDLNEQRGDAVRGGRFELSRRGGFGGSQELDFLTNLQKREDRARLDIGNTALDARNNLRQQDAALKANLIDQANRDISRDILTSNFVNNLGQGLEQAQDTAKLTQFDPFFEEAGSLFTDASLIRGDELGRNRADRALSFFGANPSRSSGTIART